MRAHPHGHQPAAPFVPWTSCSLGPSRPQRRALGPAGIGALGSACRWMSSWPRRCSETPALRLLVCAGSRVPREGGAEDSSGAALGAGRSGSQPVGFKFVRESPAVPTGVSQRQRLPWLRWVAPGLSPSSLASPHPSPCAFHYLPTPLLSVPTLISVSLSSFSPHPISIRFLCLHPSIHPHTTLGALCPPIHLLYWPHSQGPPVSYPRTAACLSILILV